MNEIVQIHEARPLDIYRMSTDAAGVCRDIVVATATTIQGRKFVSVEGWQAIALAHGCVAGSRDVEKVEGGVRAVGEVRRMSDGQLVAQAEGFVGEDETTWYGGKDKRGKVHEKRNDYAIRAMAQTRAISRACRSAFAHVVVMMKANLETTPAAEVPAEGFDRDPPHNPETGEIIDAVPNRQKVEGITAIKSRLRKLMTEGNKIEADEVGALETFNALVHEHKDDLTTIKDASHDWWTGDGDGFEGFKAWIKRRREELAATPPSDETTLAYQLLASTLQECTSTKELQAWLNKNGEVVGDLDGEESRKFEELYDTTERALKAMEIVRA